jgi:protein-S-isoprenylcysteine O-methyltransferase Ste14
MKNNTVVRIFLLVVGNALAIILGCLSLLTTKTNFLGWILLFVSIGYGAGGVFYLWRYRDENDVTHSEVGNLSFWWIVPGFLMVFFAPPLEYLYAPQILPHGISMELTGLLVILLGLSLRVWTRLTIGGLYSGYLHVRVGHLLVKDGPYRFVRHPGYTGFIIMALGLAIGFSSLIGLLAIPILLIPGLAYRMGAEEKLLAEHFGDEYRQYASKTDRLIPGLW